MRKIICCAALIIVTLLFAACGTSATLMTTVASVGARILSGVTGTATEREALCNYYGEHRDEIGIVREYYRANWSRVPEQDKPVLLKLNEQLDACNATTTPREKTTARALLDACKRAVVIYRELKAAGVI
jgi:hypothetical protein